MLILQQKILYSYIVIKYYCVMYINHLKNEEIQRYYILNLSRSIPICVTSTKENIPWGSYDYTTPKHIDRKPIYFIYIFLNYVYLSSNKEKYRT